MEQQPLEYEPLRTEANYLAKPSGSQQDAVAADLPVPASSPMALSQNTAELEALARSLWPHNPVRKLAIESLSGQPLPTIQPLLDALAHPSLYCWKDSVTAAGTVAHAALIAEQKSEAVAVLHQLLQGNQRQNLLGRRTTVEGIVVTLITTPIILASAMLCAGGATDPLRDLSLSGISCLYGVVQSPHNSHSAPRFSCD